MINDSELKAIWQQALSQMLVVFTTVGGKAGETTWFSIPGRAGKVKGVCASDIKKGECLAVFTDKENWWLIDTNIKVPLSKNIRNIEYRRCEQFKTTSFKVPILFEVQANEQKHCTCPTYKQVGKKCKEVCDGTGEFKKLADCLKGNLPGEPLPDELSCVLLMSISQFSQKKWQRFVFSPNNNPLTYYYFGYEENQIQQYGVGKSTYNIYSLNNSFIFKIIEEKPDFPISINWYGNLRWQGERDLERLINSGVEFVDSEENSTDPYYHYRNPRLIETASPAYWLIYSNPDGTPRDPAYPEGGYHGQFYSGFITTPFNGATSNFSIAARVMHSDIGKAIAYLQDAFRSRVDGNLKVDYILYPDWEPPKPGDPPPPPPTYEPPSPKVRSFWLGGDRFPKDLEFSLNIDDPFEAHLSAVQKKRIITIKHGKHSADKNYEWCKITTIFSTSNDANKTTFTNPSTPIYPDETWSDWRSSLSHSYGQALDDTDKCNQLYRNNKEANKIGRFVYLVEKAKLEPEVNERNIAIELTKQETENLSSRCDLKSSRKFRVKVFQISDEASVKILNVAPVDENQRP